MNCRPTSAHKVRPKLGFKRFHIVLTKEESLLTKIMSSFERENMQTQYNVLGYKNDLYFHDFKPVIEIDENGYSYRNIDYEINIQKAIENSPDFILYKNSGNLLYHL